jgi:hypothetical protein
METGSCVADPLHLAIVFDQSRSMPMDSARREYSAILSVAHSSLRTGDRLSVFRLPDSTETEVELASQLEVQPGEAIASETIVEDVLRRPTQHSDLAKAVRSVAARLEESSCGVVVLVTDGSLSPSRKLSAPPSPDDILRIVRDFRSSVEGARQHVILYAVGYGGGERRLAIDSTYWPKPGRDPVLDKHWMLTLDTLRGETLLRHVFGYGFLSYSPKSVADLLLFSDQAVFRRHRGYRSGLPSHGEQIDELYFRIARPDCGAFTELYPGIRRVEATNGLCVFHSMDPSVQLVQSLKSDLVGPELEVVHRPARVYTFDGISPTVPFRHGFVIGSNSSPCTPQTLLQHLVADGIWPPSISSTRRVYISWRPDSVDLLKDDSLALIEKAECYALYDLFTTPVDRTPPISSMLFSAADRPSVQGPVLEKWFRQYPSSNFVARRTILNGSIWRIKGNLRLAGREQPRLFIKGAVFDLVETGIKPCRQQVLEPDGGPCYEINARFTASEGVRVGVVVPENKTLDTCDVNCFPVEIHLKKPWLRLAVVLLIMLAVACFLELCLEEMWPWLRETIERRIGKRERTGLNVLLNIALTTAWLSLAYVVAEAAVIPGADLFTQGLQIFLAFLGAGVVVSVFDATVDIASGLLMS